VSSVDQGEAIVASNYEAICEENRQRYGTDIARIGPMLLSDRYDDRTHFIFELLQNAEDAIGKRVAWKGSRRVSFSLSPGMLILSHFGRPFDEADVRGVCGIAESTKDESSIGRFGIGFKSVYTFTDRPEIHSGDEDFAVENYVLPIRAERSKRVDEETQIVLPLRSEDETANAEITEGFKRLGPSALLFLRNIDEINWSVQDGASGFYLRSGPVELGPNVQRITVIGQETGQPAVDQNWLVLHQDVRCTGKEKLGRVEVALSLQIFPDQPGRFSVIPVPASPLVVFFPTAVETNLGFLVQGPYKTTPSRDNIPRQEPWNRSLVEQTAELLVKAMRWLRDNELLDISALRCLPLDKEKFPEGSMFEPMFAAARMAFLQEPLLPQFNGGYVEALRSKLARTQELRELFSPQQVAHLFGTDEAMWLASDITLDRTPELRQYVMRELGVTEVTPEGIVPRLTQGFLEAQSDNWIERLYEFLGGQPALKRRLDAVPLVRLNDGRHVVARVDGELQAFLPGDIETGFPTVRRNVCTSQDARLLLASLGLTAPDLVDDVVLNVLVKYRGTSVAVTDEQYAGDIDRIVAAFNTDSKTQREKLLAALRSTTFVMVVDGGDKNGYVEMPGNVYIATDRLKMLFDGVPDVMIVDDAYPCLRGENVRELLEACGAARCPRPIEPPDPMPWEERRELRRRTGHEETSGVNDQVVDWLLQGFDKLIELLPTLPAKERGERARLLWDSLGDLEERRGRGIFEGSYKWTHYGSYKVDFPSAFVRRLNDAAWVPDSFGELQLPRLVTFDSLGWKPNPFLLTKIEFKPPIIDQLAREAGIDPAALELLRKYGITSVADLALRLGISEVASGADMQTVPGPGPNRRPDDGDVYSGAKDLYGDDMPNIPAGSYDSDGDKDGGVRGAGGAVSPGTAGPGGSSETTGSRGGGHGSSGGVERTGEGGNKGGTGSGKRASSLGVRRPFISYVGTLPDGEEPDPDGLDQANRMAIESQAIAKIIALEPSLMRTADGNPGYDLYETDASGKIIRWVEVKSMTGTLVERPVGLSKTQFDCARERGSAYWIYIVERATDPLQARILRIQDPYSVTRTFTFDKGWAEIARTDPPT
jgi:hypothetical protein